MLDTTTDPDGSVDERDVTPVGVKLGSNRTAVVYAGEDGTRETVHTLSCLAIPDNPDAGDAAVHYGEAATRESADRTEYVLRSGLPPNADRARRTAQFFDALCSDHGLPRDSAVVYAIPTVDDGVGLANLNAVVEQSDVGGALTRGFPESLCGAIPAVGDGLEAIDRIFATVNLGAATLEAAAYRYGERQTPFVTTAATGNDVDRAIADAIAAEADESVTLARETAREYKETRADFDSDEPFSATVEGSGGEETTVTVERGVMDPLDDYLDSVVDELGSGFFSRLANERMKTHQLALSRPLVVTGGMACIPGLADELAARLGDELDRDLTAVTADRPDLAAAEGAYRIATRLAASD